MANFGFIVALLTIGIAFFASSFYTVPEGYVGVLYRGGALIESKGLSSPGIHSKFPIIDDIKIVQISMQTDSVENIPCGTNSGTLIYFDKIEVVNRLKRDHVLKTVKEYTVEYDQSLIYSKIHHLINQMCSQATLTQVAIENFDKIDDQLLEELQKDCDRYDAGLEIISVRVTKPRLPESVRKAFEQKDAERANLALAKERAAVAELEARANANQRRIQAETEKEVKKIAIEKEIMEREGEQKKIAINDAIFVASEKAKADAALYQKQKEAEANRGLMTKEYVQLETVKAMNHNTKYYFGEKIPSAFYQQQLNEQEQQQHAEAKKRNNKQ